MKKVEHMHKIDVHVHSKGVSTCSCVSVEELVEQKLAQGYDGMVLTNHCQAWYYDPPQHGEYVKSVLAEYERGRAYGAQRNFRVLLGLEVTINKPFYSDWLLYGVTGEFLAKTPCLYNLNQRELFELCEENGVVLVQAHPYRANRSYCEDMRPGDPRYMHGVEINCTEGDLEKKDEVLALARQNGLLVTCGTDYHGPNRTFRGGMYLPEGVERSADLACYLRQTDETNLFLEEEMIVFPIKRNK